MVTSEIRTGPNVVGACRPFRRGLRQFLSALGLARPTPAINRGKLRGYSLPGPRQLAVAEAGQDRLDAFYLRAAQAYMLISMPTGTSTIFGVFQLIRVSPKQCRHDIRAGIETRVTLNAAQAGKVRC